MPDISGELGTGSVGTPTPERAVSLSGWFSRGRFAAMTGLDGACSVGSLSYVPQGGYDWLLVDYADRLIDWAYAGIPGGIPARATVYTTLGLAGQLPTYVQSVTAAQINAALTACPAGQTVGLYTGTYPSAASINFGALKEKTLRGAGPGQTILDFSSLTSGVTFGTGGLSTATRYNITGGIAKGAMSFVMSVAPPATATVGGLVLIDELAEHVLMWQRDSYPQRCHKFLSRVASVTNNGDGTYTIGIATPNHYAFTAGLTPQARFLSYTNTCSMCGIENLTITTSTNNTHRGVYGYESDRCWAYKVDFDGLTGSPSGMVVLTRTHQFEVRRCFLHDCYNYPAQADGYGVYSWEDACNTRVEDIITDRTGEAYLQSFSAGNVYAYSYSHRMDRGSYSYIGTINMNHGAWPNMCLCEGNHMPAWENDGYHGSASYLTAFRNNIHGTSPDGNTRYRWLINLARAAYNHVVVGNIIGHSSWTPNAYEMTGSHDGWYSCIYKLEYPNSGNTSYVPAVPWTGWTEPFPTALVRNSLLRHGNYDYHSIATVWDSGIPQRDIPNSLLYSSKPAYFGSLDWPPIGPDVAGRVKLIPAKHRWDSYVSSGVLADLFADEV